MPNTPEDALEACRELQRRLAKAGINTSEWLIVIDAIAHLTLAALIKQVEISIAQPRKPSI